MPLPNTYLLTAPGGSTDIIGTPMTWPVLLRGLRKCNPRINMPFPKAPSLMGQDSEGYTSLWLGEPHHHSSKMLMSLHLKEARCQAVPEFSVLDGNGCIVTRGWRSVIEKLVNGRIISRRKASRIFQLDLTYDGWDGYCVNCRKDGKLAPADGNAKTKLCDFCEEVAEAVESPRMRKAVRVT